MTEVETPRIFGGLLANMRGEVTEATPLQECSPLTNRGTDEHVPQEEPRGTEAAQAMRTTVHTLAGKWLGLA